jgi:Calcineurin-like phosphoesterase
MTSAKRLMGLYLILLCKSGLTFLQRTTAAYRLSCARMNSIPTQNNSTILPAATGKSDISSLDEVTQGSTTVRFDPSVPNFATSANVVRSSYRNSGSDVPLTVSSSIGSHSYRENRPSSELSGRFDRDRDRTSSNGLRSSKDRPSGSSSPYRGRGSSRPSGGGAGPDVIFSSGFENNRNSRGAKESFENNNNRDYRDSNNNQKAFSKPWKNRRPFDPAVVGIESTQDYPSSSYRTVVYDHLATTSLEGIEALPNIRFSKGRTYLTRWWNAAKKWDLLCDELLEIDELFLSKSAAPSKKENMDYHQAEQNSPRPSIPSKPEKNTPIQDESIRISAVLSQLVDGGSSPSALGNETIDLKNVGVLGYLDASGDVKLSGTLSADPGTVAESVAENKINELITETIKSVLSLESDGWESSSVSNPSSKEPEAWATDSPSGSGSGSGGVDAAESETSSSSIDSEDIYSVTRTGKKRDSESEWQPNMVDDIDDNYKGNNGNDRQWTQEGTRAYSENDASVPIDILYAMCEKQKARVICIGDVHGCIDELKDLLREVKYMPGDLVLLLGDLVAKGD